MPQSSLHAVKGVLVVTSPSMSAPLCASHASQMTSCPLNQIKSNQIKHNMLVTSAHRHQVIHDCSVLCFTNDVASLNTLHCQVQGGTVRASAQVPVTQQQNK
jgi:hypothetical protein